MGIYADTGALKVTVNDTTGKGRYAADGSARVTLVPGTSFTGLYAADGSMNVVDEEGSLYHPCGAIRGRAALVTYTGLSSPSGALYMSGLVPSVFSPLSLFSASEQGFLYDPSDFDRYMAGGTELVSNGDFSNGSTDWTLGSGWSVSSGVASVVAPGAATDLSTLITLTAGKTYRITCTISNYTSGSITPRFSGGTNSIGSNFPAANGTFTQFLVAKTGNNIFLFRTSTTASLSVDNISVKEVVDLATATMFQDVDETLPVIEVEQPVALIKDLSRVAASDGPELVNNGTFDSATTGWTATNSTLASVSGELEVTGAGGFYPRSDQSIAVTSGALYRVSITMRRGTTASNAYFNVPGYTADIQTTSTTNQTYTFIVRAPSSSLSITLGIYSGTGSGTAYFDNISVKAIRTNHAYQTSSAPRPVLSAKVNQLTYTEWFDNAVWIKSNTTITPNAFAAPDGSLMATKLEAAVNADIAGQQVYQALTTLGPGNYIYTIYAKQGSGATDANTFAVRDNTAAVNHVVVSIDYSTGVLTQSTGSGATSTDVGNGWWRISMPFTLTLAAGNSIRFNVGSRGLTETVGEFCYAWGADVRLANSGVTLPVYQRVFTGSIYDTAGFPYYLKFDGNDDFLQTTNITPGTDKVQMFAGIRKLSDAASGIFIEMSPTVNSNPGTFSLFAPSGAAANYATASRGSAVSVVASYTDATVAAPVTNQLSILSDISGDNLVLRVNGSDVAQSTSDQGTGNFTSQQFFIGRRAGTSTPFNGHMYNLIVRFGSNLPASTISDTETWVNGKTKAY